MMFRLFIFIGLCLAVALQGSSLLAKGKKPNKTPPIRSEKDKRLDEEEIKKVRSLELQAKKMKLDGEGRRAASAKSGKAKLITTQCPVCETRFKAWDIDRQPPEKGMDRDFCKHAKNPSAYDFDIWFCSTCGYANFKNHFPNPVSEELKQKVMTEGTKMLAKLFKDIYQLNVLKLGYALDQEDLPSAAKYILMKIYIDDLDFSHKLKAKFYLMYAWVERMRFISALNDPTLVALSAKMSEDYSRFSKGLQADFKSKRRQNEYITMTELKKYNGSTNYNPWMVLEFLKTLKEEKMSGEEKLLKYTYEAKQWDRLGMRLAAEEALKNAAKQIVSPNLRKLITFRNLLLNHEYRMMHMALLEIKMAMKDNEYTPDELPQYVYLLGELYRRSGLYDEARIWLEFSATLPKDKYFFASWANDQIKLLPKNIERKASDLEYIFLSKVQKQLKQVTKKRSTKLEYLKNNPEQIITWLRIIDKATHAYFDRFEMDPKSIKELLDEGFFSNYPDIEKAGHRYFELKVDKRKALKERYTVISLLPYPYKETEGYFFPAIQNGAVKKIKME